MTNCDHSASSPLNLNPTSFSPAAGFRRLLASLVPGFPTTDDEFLAAALSHARGLVERKGWNSPDDQTLEQIVSCAWTSTDLLYQASGQRMSVFTLANHLQDFLLGALHRHSLRIHYHAFLEMSGDSGLPKSDCLAFLSRPPGLQKYSLLLEEPGPDCGLIILSRVC